MARRFAVPAVIGAVLAAGLVATAPAHAADAPDVWSSENGGPGNAAINPGETVLTPAAAKRVQLNWTRADATSTTGAPAIVDGVGYEVVNTTGKPSSFQAFSLDDGSTLWSVALPPKATYPRGVSISGTVALMSFDGVGRAGGVTAVGLGTQRVIWSVPQPKPAAAGADRTVSGPLVADGEKAYLLSPFGIVSSYALSNGTVVWKTALAGAQPAGFAVASKSVFTGGSGGVVAFDSATGKKQWTGPGVGAPVAAGGRVVTALGKRVVALAASGCGAATCDALWDVTLPYPNMTRTAVGGLDGVNGYLVYTNTPAGNGGIVRFGAVTGQVLWKATIKAGAVRPVRGASTVWTVADDTLLGFSTSATGGVPAKSLPLTTPLQTATQSLALAAGTVFVRAYPRQLGAFGLPGA